MEPMATAPKSGEPILAWELNGEYSRWVIVRWGEPEPFGNVKAWTTYSEGPGYSSGFYDDELKGWMPLPPAG